MASRKRKSIGSRPTAQYDTRRFSSLDVWTRYTNNVLGRNILPERKVEIYHSELDEFKVVSYPNFVRGLLLDNMQPLIGRFEILGILCFTICEVPRHAGNQKEAGLRDP